MHISAEEVCFDRRGFPGRDRSARTHLEDVGRAFLHGYSCAIDAETITDLVTQLDKTPPQRRGFAYEGAAMALALLDNLTPWRRNRVATLLAMRGDLHTYLIHAGIGFAWARLRRSPDKSVGRLDPLLGWLAVDGYGFHEGFFSWRRTVESCRPPGRCGVYGRRVFDQGLGRSLWFVHGAHCSDIHATIERFDTSRRADLWSGVGLACAYAGGVAPDDIATLAQNAGAHRAHLAQGVAFAATARARAGHIPQQTHQASHVICNLEVQELVAITLAAAEDLHVAETPAADLPAYEMWRARIRSHCEEAIRN